MSCWPDETLFSTGDDRWITPSRVPHLATTPLPGAQQQGHDQAEFRVQSLFEPNTANRPI
eukprot:scaffold22957_cov58-Phaeocystis_antarctica.AAC.8